MPPLQWLTRGHEKGLGKVMLEGAKIRLREATEADKRNVYLWLAHSDVTPSMMGPPHFPDHAIPTWDQFCADYLPHYFDGSDPKKGRCFIILFGQEEVGVVSYNALRENRSTDIDIWLKSLTECGKGFGSDAINTLTEYLHTEHGVQQIVISPSARNPRAVAAYQKVGFELVSPEVYHHYLGAEEMEYEDNLVLVKRCQSDSSEQQSG